MMAERWRPDRVFVNRHPVDMRKQIDGLAALVATERGQDPADRSMYGSLTVVVTKSSCLYGT